MNINETTELEQPATTRDRAVKRLRKRRDFYGHLVVYAVVNSFLVAIWAVTTPHGFFCLLYTSPSPRDS